MNTLFATHRPTTEAAEEILDRYFPVLDHGFVALVDYMGGDEDIVRAARVSYATGNQQVNNTRGLIRHLYRHKHTSPLEMVELKFHCSMPIFVARQWIRHRTANVNEFSGRYSIMPMLFYTPPADQLRPQSKTNKQGRDAGTFDAGVQAVAYQRWFEQRAEAIENYEWFCGQDFARELARIDLPLSTYTQWYWKIDLHNLLHFLTLRVDSHAQWEIQQFGKVMAGMLKRVAPLSYEAWIDYEVCGARLSRMELMVLRHALTFVPTASISRINSIANECLEQEFSPRELDEFQAVFDPGRKYTTPDFELDLSQARDAEYFEAQAAAASTAPSARPGAKLPSE